MEILNTTNAKDLIGKIILWKCEGYEMNAPYGGVAVLKGVNTNEHRCLKVDDLSIYGNLYFAFYEPTELKFNSDINYSDSSRYIEFELLDELKADNYEHFGTPPLALELGSKDIGKCTVKGHTVYTTWGHNYTKERVEELKVSSDLEYNYFIKLGEYYERVLKPGSVEKVIDSLHKHPNKL